MGVETSRGAGSSALSELPDTDAEMLPSEDDNLPEESHNDETPAETYKRLVEWIDNANIARDIDQQTLDALGNLVVDEYEIDEQSRSEWKSEAESALKFAVQKAEPKQYPWASACYSLDTDVLTDAGWRPIGAVRRGEMVLSRAPDGTAAFHPVSHTFRYHALQMVQFQGKSIDLLVTENHAMLVEDTIGKVQEIPAGNFVTSSKKSPNHVRLAGMYIPLCSAITGRSPETIHGLNSTAYCRFMGWYLSEGFQNRPKYNRHRLKDGNVVDYGPTTGSFFIAQSHRANVVKCAIIERDLEACGFTFTKNSGGYTVHARSMPDSLKSELHEIGTCSVKELPHHVMGLAPALLSELLDTLVMGDGHTKVRKGRANSQVYFTTSMVLADQVQEICQRVGMRGTISERQATAGGVINGRPIIGGRTSYTVSFNRKTRIQVGKLSRRLVHAPQEVACVQVDPHNTLYVRRNGKAVWCGNSNVIYPLITSAAMRFGAVAYPAIVPSRNVVKGVVWGDDKGTPATQDGKPDGAPKLTDAGQPIWLQPPGSKAKVAEKIGEHMSWQLLEQLGYWEEQTDTMLHQLPIVGGAVRKTYRDAREDTNASELVDLMNLVWNMGARSFEKAPRHTEIQEFYPFEIQELERDDKTFLPLNYGPGDVAPQGDANPDKPAADPSDTNAPHIYLEQHRRYDLDGDGYDEPLIITVHQRSRKVVRIVARYEQKDLVCDDKTKKIKRIEPCESYTLYRFLPNPKGGSYPCGFGHYLKPLNEAINTTLNQMFDAGHLQIAGGGFIGSGLSLHAGATNFSIGEYKPVNTKGGNIRDNVFPIPWPGPNVVLFQMLGFLVGAGKEIASIQDVLTGDAAMANTPPTTMLALVDQGMKVYTAIYKRIYRALKSELKKLYRLNRIYLTKDERYQIGDTWRVVTPDDYRLGGGVEPIADPTMVTDMQRITRAALIVDRAKNNPLINPLAAERYLFQAAQIPRVDDFLPEQMPPKQPSPEENKAILEQHRLQFEMQESQSKLGLTRAQELQAYTTAMLNFAKAKGEMSGPQIEWMEAQLTQMRLHIEALNTTVKAAAVDAKMHSDRLRHHGVLMGHAVQHSANLADTAARARETADEQPGSADNGGGSPASADIPQPGGDGDGGPGISAVAPQSGNTMLPPIPGT